MSQPPGPAEPAPSGWRTRGQADAVAALRSMLARGGTPQSLLLVGPRGSGKTTVALDVAAAQLCSDPDPAARPCRSCRSCRMVEHGNHPDIHRLAPAGPGDQIGIGGTDRPRGVRDLVADLALMPVEGGARVAIVESADRMTEDAQSAFLKTLEEPPDGVVTILCADDDARLLPTIRSRCARIRLGPVGARDIEALLAERGVAEPPIAARLARLAGGRPGAAMSYALSPEAQTIRAEIARRLLDLLQLGRSGRLVAIRELAGRGGDLVRALETGAARGRRTPPAAVGAGAAAGGAGRSDAGPLEVDAEEDGLPGGASGRIRIPAAERRRGALALVGIWRGVTRDLTLYGRGERRRLADPSLLEDLERATARLDAASAGSFLARLVQAGDLMEANVAPELTLDVLAVAWGSGGRHGRDR